MAFVFSVFDAIKTRRPDQANSSDSTGGMGTAGSSTMKVDPFPSVLLTESSPPIISTNRLLMLSPKPVPPYSLVVVVVACEYSSKIVEHGLPESQCQNQPPK